MAGFENCIKEIKTAAGVELSDAEIERLLTLVAQRAALKQRARPDLSRAAAMTEAAAELSAEAKQAAAIEKRNALMNLRKRISRREFYEGAPDLLLGLEAKLVGVNTPFAGSRLSVDAQGKALRRDYLVGLATDLDRAGLFETMRSGALDRQWARELFELNRAGGAPGITGDRNALKIAETVARYQKLSVDNLNRAGAWVGKYDGYITRTGHDADRIRRAGYETWKAGIQDKLDARTFDGVEDAEEFLQGVYNGLVTGVHLTQHGLQGFKAPAFKGPGNLAKRLSQGRVLHFKDADSWVDYQREFGTGTLIETVLRSLDTSARSTALMREFGTNPRGEFEADLQHLKEKHRSDTATVQALRNAETGLANRFSELDGTAMMPVNRTKARIGAGWRAVQSMAKLGGVVVSAITDVPLKAAELRYQGINFLEREADGLTALFRGRGTGEIRDVYDLLRAGADGMVGDIAARFDGADTTPGTLSKLANVFFRFTGLTYWTDAQRGGAELVMARHLGKQTGSAWTTLPPETTRLLTMFGIAEMDWNRVRAVDHTQADGRIYLTPDAALKIPNVGSAYAQDLALKIHALYADRGEYAVLAPGAREMAMLRQGTQPGTNVGEALRILMQFKAFPVAVISKTWGREIHGRDGGFGAVAGIVYMMAAATVFGAAAMTIKDLLKGRTPRDFTDPKAWAAAFVQGGGAGIYGDFIVGEYSRFGRSLAASLAGPTFGQLDDAAEIWNRTKEAIAGKKDAADVAATVLRSLISNTPFANLAYVKPALDLLFVHQVQEALNPGYLRRFERRVQKENKQDFWLRPSDVVPAGGGGFPKALIPGSAAVEKIGGSTSKGAPVIR